MEQGHAHSFTCCVQLLLHYNDSADLIAHQAYNSYDLALYNKSTLTPELKHFSMILLHLLSQR